MARTYKNRNRTGLRCYLTDKELQFADTLKEQSGCSMSELLRLGLASVASDISVLSNINAGRDGTREYKTTQQELRTLVNVETIRTALALVELGIKRLEDSEDSNNPRGDHE